ARSRQSHSAREGLALRSSESFLRRLHVLALVTRTAVLVLIAVTVTVTVTAGAAGAAVTAGDHRWHLVAAVSYAIVVQVGSAAIPHAAKGRADRFRPGA